MTLRLLATEAVTAIAVLGMRDEHRWTITAAMYFYFTPAREILGYLKPILVHYSSSLYKRYYEHDNKHNQHHR